MREAVFTQSKLSGADFSQPTLVRTDFTECKLGNALLTGANLSSATLHRANLRCADRCQTDSQDADLRRVDLPAVFPNGGRFYKRIFPWSMSGLMNIHLKRQQVSAPPIFETSGVFSYSSVLSHISCDSVLSVCKLLDFLCSSLNLYVENRNLRQNDLLSLFL